MRVLVSALAGLVLSVTLVWAADPVPVDPENTLMIEVAGQSEGVIEIELLPEIAPEHVARIKRLAREGYYNDVVFHRVIDGFMAQTGDVQHGRREGFLQRYAGSGGSIYPDLKAEFSDVSFERGVVGMARSSRSNDTANSQFFIMFQAGITRNGVYFAYDESLQGKYTVFGRVIEGMDVVDAIRRGDPDQNGSVTEPDYMKRVWIKADG